MAKFGYKVLNAGGIFDLFVGAYMVLLQIVVMWPQKLFAMEDPYKFFYHLVSNILVILVCVNFLKLREKYVLPRVGLKTGRLEIVKPISLGGVYIAILSFATVAPVLGPEVLHSFLNAYRRLPCIVNAIPYVMWATYLFKVTEENRYITLGFAILGGAWILQSLSFSMDLSMRLVEILAGLLFFASGVMEFRNMLKLPVVMNGNLA